jgi:hypothetical protein
MEHENLPILDGVQFVTDPSFLTPEMFASLVNNGLGGVAVILLFQVNARMGRIVAIISDHETRISILERRNGIEHTRMADV